MEDTNAYRNLAHFTRAFSLVILCINIYYFCYPFFADFNISHEWVTGFLVKFQKTGLFNYSIITKTIAFLFLAVSCVGTLSSQSDEITWKKTLPFILLGPLIYFGADLILVATWGIMISTVLYIIITSLGFLMLLKGGTYISRILKTNFSDDIFNTKNQTFPQEERLIENEYSVNIPTIYNYQGRKRKGWINVVNPFRGGMVLGTPGSGKSFVFVNNYIKQLLSKGFSVYIYDYKFDDLTRIAYNELLKNTDKFKVKPQFFVINFDNPRKSHRCNPIDPRLMTDISDAYESANTILLNLNKSWIEKQGDFFVESPINFLAGIIWFLKLYQNGKYCTFPHVIEFLNLKYDDMFPILGSYDELQSIVSPFVSAFESGAADQLEGQIASARIGLARLSSKALYYTMSGNDFTLDINNPEEPKVLCIGNNPLRQGIYGAALGLYNARLVKIVNKKGRIPSLLCIDELGTIYFKGLDQLIATARSNKVATLLGFQDFSQLERDYGKKESTVTKDIIGNKFVGQVKGETAKLLQEEFGKINQTSQSISVSQSGTSVSTSTRLDYAIPASVMATLSQGNFAGSVADDVGQEIELKLFHAKMDLDLKQLQKEGKEYVDVPEFRKNFFIDKEGKDITDEIVDLNYKQIKLDIKVIVKNELERISQDEEYKHLIKTDLNKLKKVL